MLNKEQTILVIVDIQGKLAQIMHDKEALFANIEKVIKGFNVLELPIILLEQVPDKLGETITEITNLLPLVSPISKSSFGCMGSDEFKLTLEQTGRKQIVLIGIETHICVYQSAAQLLGAGYEVTVVSDAVSSRSPENKQVGLVNMGKLGASISSVEMLLFELLQKAEGQQFREIAGLVK